MSTQELGAVGGVFALLVFWHFVADWFPQSHKEAMAKAKDRMVRLRHCITYVIMFFWPLVVVMHANVLSLGIALVILFGSHYVIDSYVPVVLWAKHLRKAPQFENVVIGKLTKGTGWSDYEIDRITYKDDEAAFKAFVSTPTGLVLMITMDQLFHIAFLLPVAWLAVQ